MTFFDKARVLIFTHQNSIRYFRLSKSIYHIKVTLVIIRERIHILMGGGGPLINAFLRVYFDVFRQSSRFNSPPSKQHSFLSPIEIYIPYRVDTSHHLRMNSHSHASLENVGYNPNAGRSSTSLSLLTPRINNNTFKKKYF